MRRYFFSVILLFCFGIITANDSIYIKFINKRGLIASGESFLSFSNKKMTFLLVPISDSRGIRCFIFRHNKLIATGKLTLIRNEKNQIAVRNGYWRSLDKNHRQEKTYFIKDEPLILNDNIPLDEEK